LYALLLYMYVSLYFKIKLVRSDDKIGVGFGDEVGKFVWS